MLSITPISFSGIRTMPQFKKSPKINVSYPNDTFQKNTVNFTGKTNEFATWMEENNFHLNDIKNILQDKDNKLGQDNSHSAYSIPDCDDYIIRISTIDEKVLSSMDYKNAIIAPVNEDNKDINVGQAVAIIKLKGNKGQMLNVEILKKQTGKPIRVQCGETLLANEEGQLKEGVLPYEDITRKLHYQETIKEVANLPQEAFDQFIEDFTKVSEAGYIFDYLNSNNLLVDSKNQKINMIDMTKTDHAGSVEPNYAGALYAISNIYYYPTYTSSYGANIMSEENKLEALNNTAQIILKFCKAMSNKGKKFKKETMPVEFITTMMSSIPCMYAFRTFSQQGIENNMSKMNILE